MIISTEEQVANFLKYKMLVNMLEEVYRKTDASVELFELWNVLNARSFGCEPIELKLSR